MKTRAPAKKAAPGPEAVATALRETLHHAGPAGANAAGLRLAGQSPAAAARREALDALVAGGVVGRLGAAKAARYFLAEHLPTAATVGARLLALGAYGPGALDTPPVLWKEAELRRELPAHERPLLGPALDHLQAGRQVVPLRHGRSAFVAFAGRLRVGLEEAAADAPAPAPGPAAPPGEATEGADDAALFEAYRRLVRESGGFPDVKIAHLRRAAGDAALPVRLATLWREGRATLSLGDWSLADEAARAGAVELDGEKYLLVRLDDASSA